MRAAAVLGLLGLTAPQALAGTGGATMTAPAERVAPKAAPALSPVPGLPQLASALSVRKVSRRAVTAARLTYVSQARGSVTVRVDVVRLADGLAVVTDERVVEPGTRQTVRWSGRVPGGVAIDGRYEFRISLPGETAQRASASEPGAAGGAAPRGAPPPPGSAAVGRFTFLGAVFPIRGIHDYGQEGARFGAGRPGHAHEGQDVMADCGTPLVAARGGIVKHRARHSAAGNYLVITDMASGEDHMYAHLAAPATVKQGQRVETGQAIGVVGDTGRASACHLHFEIWSAPGWYTGGSPIDPLETLRRWDRLS